MVEEPVAHFFLSFLDLCGDRESKVDKNFG